MERHHPIAIDVRGLRKSYGANTVLDDIDFQVPTGTVYGLLGPNGAGKTTTVHILSTLIRPDAGEVRIAGHDLATDAEGVRTAIGVTGQFAAIDNLLTGRENLKLMADLHHLGARRGRERIDELLEQFELADVADVQPVTYSGGMRRRLDLAMGLVGDPQVVFLDEPTTGLDPRGRHTMWQIVRDLVRRGVTIFLTTQYLEEADELADRIAVLDKGRLVAEGRPDELKRMVPGGHVSLRFANPEELESATRSLGDLSRPGDDLSLTIPSDGGVRSLRTILDRIDPAIEVEAFTLHTPDLDDVFLALTGRPTTTTETTT
jgi:ABC-2 type transport system ATP-binding protein